MKFSSFNLKKEIIDALNKLNYVEATKVQCEVIPKALKGENIIVRSDTGSGKTHAFLIPILNNIDFNNGAQALIIVPTKELALQTYNFFKEFKNFFPRLSIKLFTSGIDVTKNVNDLETNSQILISTPGRISGLIERNNVNLSNIRFIVLDEIDMLSESGFFEDIEKTINLIDYQQMMVFSATISQFIRVFLKKELPNDRIIDLEKSTDNFIKHYFINTKHKPLNESVDLFISKFNPYLLFIFANKKSEVNDIYLHLKKQKINCGIISGELSQRERKAMLRRALNNEFQIIVCSDLASRGIDIPNVSDVLSVDVPNNIEYYLHRAGRTGRIGNSGNSYVFYNNETIDKAKRLLNIGVRPSYLKINGSDIVEDKNPDLNKRPKRVNPELIKEINIEKSKVKSKKVKPNYKKKVRIAEEKAKRRYKRKIIKEDIRRQRVERYRSEGRKNG